MHDLVKASASCTASLGSGIVFVGSEEADSVLLGSGKRQSQLKRTASRVQMPHNGHVSDEEELESEAEGFRWTMIFMPTSQQRPKGL